MQLTFVPSLNGTFGSYRQSTVSTTIDDGGRPIHIKPGDKVFCSFVGANRDPSLFPNPNEVRTDRPLESYIHYGIGPHKCLGMEASRVGLTAMFKVVMRLQNLRRAPGPQGQLKKVQRPGGFYVYLTVSSTSYSLRIQPLTVAGKSWFVLPIPHDLEVALRRNAAATTTGLEAVEKDLSFVAPSIVRLIIVYSCISSGTLSGN